MDLGLSGKVVLVTGAASGMGKAVAQLFGCEGAHVIAADLNESGARVTAESIARGGGPADAVYLDVTSRAAWSEVIAGVAAIDVLCNIAGPGARTGQLDTDDAEWRRQIEGHLTGVFLGCRSVLPSMMERRAGKIVNMCSFTAHGVGAGIPAYCAAFGGILAYTKNLARFAAPYQINVNCVSPGNIETPMTRSGWLDQPGATERLRETMPLGRVGQPEDVAPWFVFLASDHARHVVGSEINVSGGQLLV
jgi:NAD(P)-dependent dehydrogenase (short-subunit alcohol dehydrogenase family)